MNHSAGTQATKAKLNVERASRPHQRDIGNINTCWSPTHARVVITDWKDEYNHYRRSALGYEAPDQFMICSASQNRVGHS